MKKSIINITNAKEIEVLNNQVYVSENTKDGRKYKLYNLRTDCKRESTAVKRLVSVVVELEGVEYSNELSTNFDSIAIKPLESGYYVLGIVYEKFLDSETTNPECSVNHDATNINKESNNMEEKDNVNTTEIVDTQELLPIEPEYITRVINQANLVNAELAERTKDILYLEDDNRRNLFKIASQLSKINRGNLYKDDGFKNVSEYAEKVLGYKGSTTRALCRIADRFLTETGEIENPELADFTVYQLMEILKLNDSELQLALNEGTVSSELSTKKLRDNVKKSKETPVQESEDVNEDNNVETEKEESVNKPEVKNESTQEDEEIKHPNPRQEAIVILTSLMAQITKNDKISDPDCDRYVEQIKKAIQCIK